MRPLGVVALTAAVIVGVLGVGALGSTLGLGSSGATWEEASPAVKAAGRTVQGARGCDQSAAEAELLSARRTGLVLDLGFRDDGVHLVVSDRRWAGLSQAARDQVVSAVDCSLAAPSHVRGVVVEAASGQVFRSYSLRELRRAREDRGE